SALPCLFRTPFAAPQSAWLSCELAAVPTTGTCPLCSLPGSASSPQKGIRREIPRSRLTSGKTGARVLAAEVVDEHVHLADSLEAGALEDRSRHRAALRDQRGRPTLDGVGPACRDERAVGAASAGARHRRAAVQEQPVLGGGRRSRRDHL